jgi:hypothetical protein
MYPYKRTGKITEEITVADSMVMCAALTELDWSSQLFKFEFSFSCGVIRTLGPKYQRVLFKLK